MQPAKLDILFAFFAYGGNGGIAMQLPEITMWFSKLCLAMRDDERIGRWGIQRFGDVPLTMERNRAVTVAKAGGFDVIVMIDSDNSPDLYLDKDPNAKPFFESSFDFLYERKQRGLPTVVAAPYCGPPPHPTGGGAENVYVFRCDDRETGHLESGFSFEAYSRQEAASMTGIHPIAAGPTGCIMYSTDALDLMPVCDMTHGEVLDLWRDGAITKERAIQLLQMESYFFYEYPDLLRTTKASTEDVTNTREIQLAGVNKHGEPVVFCNWDSWAGHHKPKCVGKPAPINVNEINELYREAVMTHREPNEKLMDVSFGDGIDTDLEPGEEELADDFFLDTQPIDKSRVDIRHRMIGDRKVTSVGHFTQDAELDTLRNMVKALAGTRPGAPMRIVEVGSWVGESALALYQGLGEAGGVVYCVDTWEGSKTDWTSALASAVGQEKLFDYFMQNVGDLAPDKIRVIKGESLDVAEGFPHPQDADLVFLDAGHDYDSVRADIDAWFPHVADNGVLCGHDYTEAFPGVKQAVKELCDAAGIMPRIAEGTSIWFVSREEWLNGLQRKQRGTERVASSES